MEFTSDDIKKLGFWPRVGAFFAGMLILALIGLFIFWMGFVAFVDNHELGYQYNARTGEVTQLSRTGYFITPIAVYIHTIDLRPQQICISANNRNLNCKLVQFNPAGFPEFLKLHGRQDYDLQRLKDILMSYAYEEGSPQYPFLIQRDMRPGEVHTK